MTENNPLQKYFRQPAIYVKLPSDGQFYPEGTLEMPVNKEIPIYPMTAMDEIMARTPDALFNGSAVMQIFKSCVPNIKEPWGIPQTDVDLLLTAIKIASYGHEMEMSVTCPHCEEIQDYTLDLRTVIDKFVSPDYSKGAQLGDLEVYFRPLNYQEVNDAAKVQFEQQKTLQILENQEGATEEAKLTAMSTALQKITELSLDALTHSISLIKVDGQPVTDSEHIKEFMVNANRDVFNRIRDHLTKIRENTEMKPLKITCSNEECKKEYDQPFTMDMSNFFV
jgi:hypothetical protein